MRSLDPEAYDVRRGGLIYSEEVIAKPDMSLPFFNEAQLHYRRAYDTSQYGKANTGHDWMQDWPDEDVFAIIEFLKNLSGPEIQPATQGTQYK